MDVDYGLDIQTQANIDKMTDVISKYYNHYYEIDVKPDLSLLKDDVVKKLFSQPKLFSPPPPPPQPQPLCILNKTILIEHIYISSTSR